MQEEACALLHEERRRTFVQEGKSRKWLAKFSRATGSDRDHIMAEAEAFGGGHPDRVREEE